MKKLFIVVLGLIVSAAAWAGSPEPGDVRIGNAYFIIDELDDSVAYIGEARQNPNGGGVALSNVQQISDCGYVDNRTNTREPLSWGYVLYWGLTGKAVACQNPLEETRHRIADCCVVSSLNRGTGYLYNAFKGYWWDWTHAVPRTDARPIK